MPALRSLLRRFTRRGQARLNEERSRKRHGGTDCTESSAARRHAGTPTITAREQSARLTRILLNETPRGGWFEFCLRHRLTRNLLFGFERSSSREYSFTITRESCASLSLSQDAFSSGCRQLVMLGAGLDTLAWRHSLQTGAACFELDHPATQAIKRRAFQNEIRSPILIPADLTRDLPSRLCAGNQVRSGWRSGGHHCRRVVDVLLARTRERIDRRPGKDRCSRQQIRLHLHGSTAWATARVSQWSQAS